MLLALDTATPLVTVALHDGERVVAELSSEQPMKHGEHLAPLIARAMADAGVLRQDLTAVAVGVGPGPFTGLRVGIVRPTHLSPEPDPASTRTTSATPWRSPGPAPVGWPRPSAASS